MYNEPMGFSLFFIYLIYAVLAFSVAMMVWAVYECFSPANRWIFWLFSILGIAWLWGYVY